jgi:hypothetical protein
MKKTIFAVIVMAFVAVTTITAQEPASSFKYDLNEAGNGIVIKGYTGSNKNLVIPRTIEGYPVVEIRGKGLSWGRHKSWFESITYTLLLSVVIPEGVKVISLAAFAGQEKLTNVTLPSTLEEIGEEVFIGTGLRTIRIPDSVKKIDMLAFAENPNLTEVNIPSGIEKIGFDVFRNCRILSNLTIPASIKSVKILGDAFRGCALTLAARRRLTELGYPGDF